MDYCLLLTPERSTSVLPVKSLHMKPHLSLVIAEVGEFVGLEHSLLLSLVFFGQLPRSADLLKQMSPLLGCLHRYRLHCSLHIVALVS